VKEWLITAGLDEPEIAVKTADTDDLAAPENLDLLDPTNRVRAIITKQALQEGWDCPFAYVLCSLSASHNAAALTQLVGRILRQPHAQKTGVAALDECYVVTHHADAATVVTAIKSCLEEDGLGDLVQEIRIPDPDGSGGKGPRRIERRPVFAKTDIYLPEVLRVVDGTVRKLDYEQDILFALDWSGLDPAPLTAKIPDNFAATQRQLRRIRLVDSGKERIVAEVTGETGERLAFDPAYAVRMVSDIYEPEGADQMLGADGGPLQRSLFAPLYKNDLNREEREVAVYLDAEQSLIWWHRNVARHQYVLQGWRRERIYPDFLATNPCRPPQHPMRARTSRATSSALSPIAPSTSGGRPVRALATKAANS